MTVKEIAELAGVSAGTVDRVLYKRGRVSAQTRARVEGIIERYQFTPNPAARTLRRGRAYRFCAFIPRRDQDAGYWGQALEGILAGAEGITHLGVQTEVIEFDRYDLGDFYGKAEGLLESIPDGIVFAPIMPEKIQSFIRRIGELHIPCVFFDSELPGAAPLCSIRQDSFQGGYLAGRLMHLLGGAFTKPVAILDAHGEDYHITRRRDGFLRYAGEQGFPTVTREYSDYHGTELSEEEVLAFLEEYRDISGIFITNCLAHRVAGAVQKAGRSPVIIGYDLTPANCQFLKSGLIGAIISQRPEYQGREALLSLYRHLVLEQRIPSEIDIPLDLFIRENVPG
jgi:LacI family transcriptional regulator